MPVVTSPKRKPALFLQPMSRWHLYSKFENGVNVTSDQLQFIWFLCYYRRICIAAGLYQFYEPEYSPFKKNVQRKLVSVKQSVLFAFN